MATATINTINVKDLAAKISSDSSIELIDVRTPAEYREVHAETARNIPLDVINPKDVMENRTTRMDQPIYIICRSGNRSGKACEAFIKAGYENVVNVEGGTNAWDSAGLPVVRGRKTISLERQVRITAGFLALLGSALAFADVRFACLSGFIGAGLMFAGITDTCGMAMVLAKMPWNRN